MMKFFFVFAFSGLMALPTSADERVLTFTETTGAFMEKASEFANGIIEDDQKRSHKSDLLLALEEYSEVLNEMTFSTDEDIREAATSNSQDVQEWKSVIINLHDVMGMKGFYEEASDVLVGNEQIKLMLASQ